MVSAELTAQRLAEVLRGEGLNVHMRGYELIVAKGGVVAHVMLSEAELPSASKLLLKIEGAPGLTILECRDADEVVDCVKRLVKKLEEYVR